MGIIFVATGNFWRGYRPEIGKLGGEELYQ
jgi:hypothetical protein